MIVWLPERIYKTVMNDPEFNQLEQDINTEYDLVAQQGIVETSNWLNFNSYYPMLEEKIQSLLIDDNDKRLFDIITIEIDDPEGMIKINQIIETETDPENLLFAHYWKESLIQSAETLHYLENIKHYIQLVDESIQRGDQYSERIYVKYFQYKAFVYREELKKSYNPTNSEVELENYLSYLDQLIQDILALGLPSFPTSDTYLIDILRHKLLQEVSQYVDHFLPFYALDQQYSVEYIDRWFSIVEDFLAQHSFKYTGVTLYEMYIKYALFKAYLDVDNLVKAAEIIQQIVTDIQFRFDNIFLTIKALNHHNLDMMTSFLIFAKLIHFILGLPELNPNDISVLTESLSTKDREFVDGTNVDTIELYPSVWKNYNYNKSIIEEKFFNS